MEEFSSLRPVTLKVDKSFTFDSTNWVKDTKGNYNYCINSQRAVTLLSIESNILALAVTFALAFSCETKNSCDLLFTRDTF